jgi:hypothetical protein
VIYLGEINDSQRAAWEHTICVIDERDGESRQMALFPEDRIAPKSEVESVRVRLNDLRLSRPRQWGGCWLCDELWRELRLENFFAQRLGLSREGTDWEIGAHLFVAFLSYCLSVTLRQHLKNHASGLMPRTVFEKLGAIHMLDVTLPTTDGRELHLIRRTEADKDVALLLERLNHQLPPQPPPKIRYQGPQVV